MSLGAIVVLYYGYFKLEPQIGKQNHIQEVKISQEPLDLQKEFVKPQITLLFETDIKKEVQFLEIKRPDFLIDRLSNSGPSQTPFPNPTISIDKQNTSSVSNNSIDNSSLKISEVDTHPEVIGYIEKYASEYGVNKDMMIGIAKCESGFRSNAVNGPYAGIYQFVSGTWISNRRAMGLDESLDLRFDAKEASKTAAFKMSRDGFGAWPVCQHKAKRLIGISTEGI